MFFKSCSKILILTLMVLMLVQNMKSFEHGPEKDLINSSNFTDSFQYSSINNISTPELNKHEHINEDENNDKEIRSSSLLNGQFMELTENGTNEGYNEFETADENINTDYVIKNRKESALQSFIQTTMVPEYIQNHKIYDGEGGLYYELAIGDKSDSTSSIQTAINESKPFLIKSNILLANKQPKNEQVLETLNRSDEDDLNGANHEELEQIQTSGLIGTTLTPKLSPVASTATTYTTPSFLSISTTSVVVAPTTTLRTKQGKQIQINRLLPHEQLRNYFEDAYIRMPLAVIIDPSPNSLERTKILWRDALRKNFSIKIVLVSLNASGVPTAYNFNNTRQFLAGLNSIKENAGGNAFVGIIQASELVPYDSAIFISTALIPQHTDLVHDAAITLLKKRIRLYLVWYGERSLSENETQEATGGILGEVAIRSGGEILQVISSENSPELDGNTATLIADTFRGSQDIEIPVDTTLSSLHIKIDSMMRSATLETPNGEINLKKLVKFKSRFIDNSDIKLDAYVPLSKVKKSTIFNLKLLPEIMNMNYNVYVSSDRKPDIGKQNVNFHEDLRFPESKIYDSELISTTERNKSRLAEEQTTLLKAMTNIEMGTQSQLLVAPGMRAQLYFEITNLRVDPVYHTIQVVDDQRFLQSLVPEYIYLRGGQTGTAIVSLAVPQNTQRGTKDKITLTCLGNGQNSISVEMKVITNTDLNDVTPPSISWQFGSRCDTDQNYHLSSCSDRLWSLDITVQDWESGFLRLMAIPNGLTMRNTLTVGTNQPVRFSYVATCCQPRVTLTAFDLANNQKTSAVDVRDIVLSEASILAIVLGVLLLVLLIVLIVILIVWCCKRRKASHDLGSTYRTRSERAR